MIAPLGAPAMAEVVDFCTRHMKKTPTQLRCVATTSHFAYIVTIVPNDLFKGHELKAYAYFQGRQAHNLELVGIMQAEQEQPGAGSRHVTFRGGNPKFSFELHMDIESNNFVPKSFWRVFNAQTGEKKEETPVRCYGALGHTI